MGAGGVWRRRCTAPATGELVVGIEELEYPDLFVVVPRELKCDSVHKRCCGGEIWTMWRANLYRAVSPRPFSTRSKC